LLAVSGADGSSAFERDKKGRLLAISTAGRKPAVAPAKKKKKDDSIPPPAIVAADGVVAGDAAGGGDALPAVNDGDEDKADNADDSDDTDDDDTGDDDDENEDEKGSSIDDLMLVYEMIGDCIANGEKISVPLKKIGDMIRKRRNRM
jgi:hypothetical protein